MRWSILVAGLFASVLCRAQELPILPLGRGDVINVTIEDEPELTKRLKINDKGDIAMPLLKEPLRVDGLMPADIEALIAEAYKRERLLLNPIVDVKPAEYHSYLVKVTGAVTKPYEFQAISHPSLLSVLATAGGPTLKSNGDIEIIRHDPKTGEETKQSIPIRGLLEDDDGKYNIQLRGGEEVHLPAVAVPSVKQQPQ
jgi:polysaccharide export outer membrane protein